MKKADSKVYELVNCLTDKEYNFVRNAIGASTSPYVKVLDAYRTTGEFEERELKKKFSDFSRIKENLWWLVLDALRDAKRDDAAIELNRKLDYIHLLSQKRLHHLSMREIKQADEICEANSFMFSQGLVGYYRSLSGNYTEETNIGNFWTGVRERQEKNMAILSEWHNARLYYLKVVEAEEFRSVATSKRFKFPVSKFVKESLYKVNTDKLRLPAAILVTMANRTICLYNKDLQGAYKADEPILKRIYNKGKEEKIEPEWVWAFLLGRFNTHDFSQRDDIPKKEKAKAKNRLALYEEELKTFDKLFDENFSNDIVRENFIVRLHVELSTYKSRLYKDTTQETKSVASEFEKAINRVKQFLQNRYRLLHSGDSKLKPTEKLSSPLPAFTLSNLLLIAAERENWQLALECCGDFVSWINPNNSPDIHRFVWVIYPIVCYECKQYSYGQNLALKLKNRAKNFYNNPNGEDSYQLELVIGKYLYKLCSAGEDERKEIFDELVRELDYLRRKKDLAFFALSEYFKFIEWARLNSKKG